MVIATYSRAERVGRDSPASSTISPAAPYIGVQVRQFNRAQEGTPYGIGAQGTEKGLTRIRWRPLHAQSKTTPLTSSSACIEMSPLANDMIVTIWDALSGARALPGDPP
jgi:hypothetical protein